MKIQKATGFWYAKTLVTKVWAIWASFAWFVCGALALFQILPRGILVWPVNIFNSGIAWLWICSPPKGIERVDLSWYVNCVRKRHDLPSGLQGATIWYTADFSATLCKACDKILHWNLLDDYVYWSLSQFTPVRICWVVCESVLL